MTRPFATSKRSRVSENDRTPSIRVSWRARLESNQRPSAPEANVLSSEPRLGCNEKIAVLCQTGLEALLPTNLGAHAEPLEEHFCPPLLRIRGEAVDRARAERKKALRLLRRRVNTAADFRSIESMVLAQDVSSAAESRARTISEI